MKSIEKDSLNMGLSDKFHKTHSKLVALHELTMDVIYGKGSSPGEVTKNGLHALLADTDDELKGAIDQFDKMHSKDESQPKLQHK